MNDLDNLTKDELHGILTTYEMRTIDQTSKKEAAFKASRKGTNKEHEPSDHYVSDEEEAHFMRRLEKGLGKYKGNLPFKCFNFGKVGHFASKCPYAKSEGSDMRKTPILQEGLSREEREFSKIQKKSLFQRLHQLIKR